MPRITRFAPSPTGRLHAGHALSALKVWGWAAENNAEALLRIEDIDRQRCRPEFEAAIHDDLAWLGLTWPKPVWRQSDRLHHYTDVLGSLRERGLLYPCFCTRSEIRRDAIEDGHDGPVYAGTCRLLSGDDVRGRLAAGEQAAWRLKLDHALEDAGSIEWHDDRAGLQHWDGLGWGDVVLARKDIGVSYHLAVTTDDEAQKVTDVVRGEDLFQSTHIHVLLQRLMGWSTPSYHHHRLLLDGEGSKLSKRGQAASFREMALELGGWEALIQKLKDSAAGSS